MITRDGNEIKRTGAHRHKFGSALAEVAHGWAMGGGCDDEAGSVDYRGWAGRIGRHILVEDDRGFVVIARCESADAAQAELNEYEYPDDWEF